MTYRDDLPGYRLGEGSPLERERIKAHLESCPDCRAHLEAYELLVRDAREEPPALSIDAKDQIWQNIERELPGTQPSLWSSLSELLGARWQPALGMAAVACLAYVVIITNTTNQPSAPAPSITVTENLPPKPTQVAPKALAAVVAELSQPATHKSLDVAPGVVARTSKRSKVRKTGTVHAPRVELTAGDLLAEYTRQPKQEPMVIQTPHFEAIVRGTIFVISVDSEGSSLSVAEGKVEARRRGKSIMVRSGESVRITDTPDTAEDTIVTPQPAEQSAIDALKGLFPEHQAAPVSPAPKTPKMTASPAPKRPVLSPRAQLTSARKAWLDGRLVGAETQITNLLKRADLEPNLQDDARLLRASIYRAQGNLKEALVDLEVVAALKRSQSRVAAFELGRLALEQGRVGTAERALRQVLEVSENDVLGEEARFALCQLLTEQGSNDETMGCWEALQDASDPSLREKARRALEKP